MIISTNRNPSLEEFKDLVNSATHLLNEDGARRTAYYLSRSPAGLEDDVTHMLKEAAYGTRFQNTVKKISGQKFPDIVAGKYYGVEVKRSASNTWKTIAGSVNESTRIKDVERIFVTYGKLVDPIEFRSRPYEECLYGVALTHYPRYQIDMELEKGATIFDKMKTEYDILRTSENPATTIMDYYRSELQNGERLWWTGAPWEEQEVPLKIRLWRTLLEHERTYLTMLGLSLFPEIFSSSSKKYERFALWLVTEKGIFSSNLRDQYTAGGQINQKIAGIDFNNIPRVFQKLIDHQLNIGEIIKNQSQEQLMETWNVRNIDADRLSQWLELASDYGKSSYSDAPDLFRVLFDKQISQDNYVSEYKENEPIF